jgi:hypothetical protein
MATADVLSAEDIKAQHVQKIARFCFFAFVLLQAPCLLVPTKHGQNGMVVVSPLQLSMGSLVTRMPEAKDFAHLLLFPGTWVNRKLCSSFHSSYSCLSFPLLPLPQPAGCFHMMHVAATHTAAFMSTPACTPQPAHPDTSDTPPAICPPQIKEALVPYATCMWKTPGQCDQDTLLDVHTVFQGNKLHQLVDIVHESLTVGKQWIECGCAIIVMAAFGSLVRPMRLSVLGFVILGWGLYTSKIVPLPSGVLLAFLCSYSGFNSHNANKDELASAQRTLEAQNKLLESAISEPGKEEKKASPSQGKGRTNKHKKA